MIPKIYKRSRWKITLLWLLASLFLLFGSMIAGQLQKSFGTSETALLIAFFLALIFFLFAGLLWIAIAVALRQYEE
jgi:MFS-type transporter involved in bile tolerance (Atg22 family)